MIIRSKDSEKAAVLNTANQMACAARTAPKTKGIDRIDTVILTDDDIIKLSNRMKEIGIKNDLFFFIRDSFVVKKATAVLLIAVRNEPSGLNEICQYCGSKNCKDTITDLNACAFSSIDLGIAVGSAVTIASDNKVDNRVLFSAGRAALDLEYFEKDYREILAIPLSVSGKNPFFDRTEQFDSFE